MTLTVQSLLAALGWLSDLTGAPNVDPTSAAGSQWLARLRIELADVHPSPEELVDACRGLARAKGARYPTPGQIATAVVEARRAARATERPEPEAPRPPLGQDRSLAANLEWNVTRYTLGEGDAVPAGWSSLWESRQAIWDAAYDLESRGHHGVGSGEPIAAALHRERRERREVESRGETWNPPTYGRRTTAPAGARGTPLPPPRAGA